MARSYLNIPPELARALKLVMTDVDGTITSGAGLSGCSFAAGIIESLRELERQGITVGLVSGRNMADLDRYEAELGISGPLIGENGAVARLGRGKEVLDLGVSQQPAVEALKKLQELFPGAIEAGNWNKTRTMDLIIRVKGVTSEELARHLDDADILDSGYVYHLMQKGVNKGNTLKLILPRLDGGLPPDAVMVFGDAPTDMPLFENFPNSILILNPELPPEKFKLLEAKAGYVSAVCCDEGFIQVVRHIIGVRTGRAEIDKSS